MSVSEFKSETQTGEFLQCGFYNKTQYYQIKNVFEHLRKPFHSPTSVIM